MASILFNSFVDDVMRGNIDCDTDVFYALITSSAYTEDQDAHTKRSDVTNEITGTGYTAGGKAVSVTVTKDTANNRVTVSFGSTNWTSATMTGRKAVYYKRRGGADTADELVGVNDFGSDVVATAGTFTLNASVATFQL
jgi:hypothetical protein